MTTASQRRYRLPRIPAEGDLLYRLLDIQTLVISTVRSLTNEQGDDIDVEGLHHISYTLITFLDQGYGSSWCQSSYPPVSALTNVFLLLLTSVVKASRMLTTWSLINYGPSWTIKVRLGCLTPRAPYPPSVLEDSN